jgi:hypothetical protein
MNDARRVYWWSHSWRLMSTRFTVLETFDDRKDRANIEKILVGGAGFEPATPGGKNERAVTYFVAASVTG